MISRGGFALAVTIGLHLALLARPGARRVIAGNMHH
jgi:hypothetical protein